MFFIIHFKPSYFNWNSILLEYSYVICFMKPIALLLVACILLLSSPQGNGANMRSISVSGCCKQESCRHGKQKTTQNNGCDSKACNRMASCSQCGFIISEQLLFQDIFTLGNVKSMPPATIGVVSGYTQTGWHPPKA